jgi:hypothetical protein
MPFDSKGLEDYVDVAQRIADFREQYPGGTLQPLDPTMPFEIREITGTDKNGKQFTATMIVYIAAAYRDQDDHRPGIGCAWEPFPGRTPYTLGSELMNAETSAWGRAIIAVLASDSKRGIASREEVRNRGAEAEPAAPEPKPAKRGNPPQRAAGNLPRNRDNSTSRSQVTDTELAATGQETDAQRREHNRLERDVRGTGPQGTQRLTTTPDDDLWMTPLRVPAPAPATAGVIHQYFKNYGYSDSPEDRTARLKRITAITGRTITSVNDLTAAEGLKVVRFLEKCKDLAALDEHLAVNAGESTTT